MKCDFCPNEAEYRSTITDAKYLKCVSVYEQEFARCGHRSTEAETQRLLSKILPPSEFAYSCSTCLPLLRIVKEEPEKVDDGTWDSQGREWTPNSGDPVPAEPERVSDKVVSDDYLTTLTNKYLNSLRHSRDENFAILLLFQELQRRRSAEKGS